MFRGWWRLGLMAAAVVASLAMACSSDDGASEEDRQEVADLTVRMASINGFEASQADIDFYMEHATDGFVQVFGTESIAACAANAQECIGDPLSNPTVDVDEVKIDGDTASLPVVADDGAFKLGLVRESDVWKLDSLGVLSDEVPDGVESVDISMQDFAFVFDASSEAIASGSFAFKAKNEGEQTHEIAVVKLPEGMALMDALASEDPEASGMEFIGVKFPFSAGDEANFVLQDLAAGQYGLVCFLPDTTDPEGTPHAFKGMTAEFTVQ